MLAFHNISDLKSICLFLIEQLSSLCCCNSKIATNTQSVTQGHNLL